MTRQTDHHPHFGIAPTTFAPDLPRVVVGGIPKSRMGGRA